MLQFYPNPSPDYLLKSKWILTSWIQLNLYGTKSTRSMSTESLISAEASPNTTMARCLLPLTLLLLHSILPFPHLPPLLLRGLRRCKKRLPLLSTLSHLSPPPSSLLLPPPHFRPLSIPSHHLSALYHLLLSQEVGKEGSVVVFVGKASMTKVRAVFWCPLSILFFK